MTVSRGRRVVLGILGLALAVVSFILVVAPANSASESFNSVGDCLDYGIGC